jgi:hypothetical protein
MIKGYKAFTYPMLTRYGQTLVVGEKYTSFGTIKYGNDGNGYHFCINTEDTLRYVDGMNGKIDICEVIGSGETVKYEDDYYGYYDQYCSSELEILKRLNRNEILIKLEDMSVEQLIRFFMGFKLTQTEIEYCMKKYSNYINVQKNILYYQLNEKDAFTKSLN